MGSIAGSTLSAFIRFLSIIFLLSFCLPGCALLKLKKEVNKSRDSAVIVGVVDASFSGKGSIVVAACSILMSHIIMTSAAIARKPCFYSVPKIIGKPLHYTI